MGYFFNVNKELVRAAVVLSLVNKRKWSLESLDGTSPGNLGLGPPCHGAVEVESLALPHCLSTGLYDKLWRVRQAVWVHLSAELHPLVHLGRDRDQFSSQTQRLGPIRRRTGNRYRLAQLHPLCRFPHMCRPGLLLHLDAHSLPGLPNKQVPHGHILNPLLRNLLLLRLHQTAYNIMTDDARNHKSKERNNQSLTLLELIFSSCSIQTHLALNTGIT